MLLRANDYVKTPNGQGVLIGFIQGDKSGEVSHNLLLVAHKPGSVQNPTGGQRYSKGEPKAWDLWIYSKGEVGIYGIEKENTQNHTETRDRKKVGKSRN